MWGPKRVMEAKINRDTVRLGGRAPGPATGDACGTGDHPAVGGPVGQPTSVREGSRAHLSSDTQLERTARPNTGVFTDEKAGPLATVPKPKQRRRAFTRLWTRQHQGHPSRVHEASPQCHQIETSVSALQMGKRRHRASTPRAQGHKRQKPTTNAAGVGVYTTSRVNTPAVCAQPGTLAF